MALNYNLRDPGVGIKPQGQSEERIKNNIGTPSWRGNNANLQKDRFGTSQEERRGTPQGKIFMLLEFTSPLPHHHPPLAFVFTVYLDSLAEYRHCVVCATII